MIEENNNTTTWLEQDNYLKNLNNKFIEIESSEKILNPKGLHADCEKLLYFTFIKDSYLVYIKYTENKSQIKTLNSEIATSVKNYFLCYKNSKILLSQKPTGIFPCADSNFELNNQNYFCVGTVSGDLVIYKIDVENESLVQTSNNSDLQKNSNFGSPGTGGVVSNAGVGSTSGGSSSQHPANHTDSITQVMPLFKNHIISSSLDGEIIVYNFIKNTRVNDKFTGKSLVGINFTSNYIGGKEGLNANVNAGITCFDVLPNFHSHENNPPEKLILGYENGEIWLVKLVKNLTNLSSLNSGNKVSYVKDKKFKSHKEMIVSVKFNPFVAEKNFKASLSSNFASQNDIFVSVSKDNNIRVYNLSKEDCIFDINLMSKSPAVGNISSSSNSSPNSILKIFWVNSKNLLIVDSNSLKIYNLLEYKNMLENYKISDKFEFEKDGNINSENLMDEGGEGNFSHQTTTGLSNTLKISNVYLSKNFRISLNYGNNLWTLLLNSKNFVDYWGWIFI